MLYKFRKNDNLAIALENIHAVYPNSLSKATVKRQFARFRSGDFSLKDEPKPGRNVEFDTSVLEALVESSPKLTTCEMASELNTNHITIKRYLERLGKVHRFVVWVPHKLSEQNLVQKVTISSLLSRHLRESFLDRIVTSDEKRLFYANVKRRK